MAVVRKRDDCIHEPVCAVCGALSCPAECGHYIKVEKFTSYNKQSTPCSFREKCPVDKGPGCERVEPRPCFVAWHGAHL